MTKMRQVILYSEDTIQTVWVDDHPNLKKGCDITLKDDSTPTRSWKVVQIFSNIIEKNTLYKPWRVGGLD